VFHIWYPHDDIPNQISDSLRVGLEGGGTAIIIEGGTNLPMNSKPKKFYTAKALKKGAGSDILRIPVLHSVKTMFSAEDDDIASSTRVGYLEIKGDDGDVTQDVPLGTPVWVELACNESQEIKIIARIEGLNAEFSQAFQGREDRVEPKELLSGLRDVESRLFMIRAVPGNDGDPNIADVLSQIEQQQPIAFIHVKIDAATGGDDASIADALSQAGKRLAELNGTSNQLWQKQRRARLQWQIENIIPVAEGLEHTTALELKNEFARAGEDDYLAIERQFDSLNRDVRFRPMNDLILSVLALVPLEDTPLLTSSQKAMVKSAQKLLDDLFETGAWRIMDRKKIDEVKAMSDRIANSISFLAEAKKHIMDVIGNIDPSSLNFGTQSNVK
jgi:hypothetical protein